MGSIRKDFKYKIVKNFITKEEQELARGYCIGCHKKNFSNFDERQNINGDTYVYRDVFFQTLLSNKLNLMEKETGLKLFPTYAFWRMYTKFADLKKHKDRPSCEISVTVMIDSDGTNWPIFIDGTRIDLEPGDAAIYLGCEVEHWRETFDGDWHAQAFLHYVDQDGPNKDYKFDKHRGLGIEI